MQSQLHNTQFGSAAKADLAAANGPNFAPAIAQTHVPNFAT